MKRAVLFLNGDRSDVSRAAKYIKQTDLIIAADGGTEHLLTLGLLPHIIIGDNDSLSEKTRKALHNKPIVWKVFKKEKDETDSELALQYIVEEGYKDILVFGLLGTRIDHFLTNIFILAELKEKGINVLFLEGNQEIQVIGEKIHLKGNAGDLISLIPLKGDASGVSTTKLQYPLKNEQLFFGYSRGISNVMTDKTATVTIKKGLLLVIHSFL
jgi:thiamine pyrophosphokinase